MIRTPEAGEGSVNRMQEYLSGLSEQYFASSPILKHVFEAVLRGLTTRYGYCKHYRASVPCKASDKFYHWPWAVASGCFMQKASLSMVNTERYDKVTEVSPTATYLYYTGEQWKIGKKAKVNKAVDEIQKIQSEMANIMTREQGGQDQLELSLCSQDGHFSAFR